MLARKLQSELSADEDKMNEIRKYEKLECPDASQASLISGIVDGLNGKLESETSFIFSKKIQRIICSSAASVENSSSYY